MSNTDTATLDKIAGIVTIATSACGMCLGGAVLTGGSLASVGGVAGTLTGHEAGIPVAAIGGIAVVIAVFLLLGNGIKVAGGIGIVQSKRWGFVVTAVVAALGILLSLGNGNRSIDYIDVGLCAYCILRLTGHLGERP